VVKRVTMLGSGTSSGVPMIGCRCAVCTSPDPRNRRMRPGLRLDLEGGTVVVDTSPDFREQALTFGLERVDAVLYTHPHADHVFGLDDLRGFNFRQRTSIPCYGSAATMARLRQIFAYVFEDGQEGGGKPQLEFVDVREPFELLGETVVPVPVEHGEMEVFGYRIGDFAVVTDVGRIPEASFARLAGVRVLVLSALRYRPHPTHFTIEEACAAAARIGAERTLLTHIAHDVDHTDVRFALSPSVEIGHDGLVVELG
jgi:phosphoribosyl 1,2-cyclic phosphate phosphodiesterase